MSFTVGPLWTGHLNASFNHGKSRQHLTFLFGFGSSIKLLHYFAVSPMPWSLIVSCCCSHLSLSWMAFVMHIPMSWWCLVWFAVYFNMQWKQPILVSTSLDSFCSCPVYLWTHPPVSFLTWSWKEVFRGMLLLLLSITIGLDYHLQYPQCFVFHCVCASALCILFVQCHSAACFC